MKQTYQRTYLLYDVVREKKGDIHMFREKKSDIHMIFIDLEKDYNRVPKEVILHYLGKNMFRYISSCF